MQPQDGDGEVFVRNTVTDAEWRSPRGYRQPTPPPDPLNFSADGTFLFFIIEPDKADLLKARKDKKRLEDFPKNRLGIMNTATGQVTKIEQVKNYQISENGSVFDAILNEPAKEDKKPADKKKEYGSALILRSLIDGNERAFADVSEYAFSKDAKSLVYAVSSQKEANNGVFAVVPQTGVAPVSLLSGAGKYQKLTWDEKQTQLAFIGDTNDAAAKQPKFKVYHWLRAAPNAAEAVSVKTANFPLGYVVSEKAVLNFSADGRRLFVGTAPEPEANPNDAVPDGEKVTVDL